MKKTAEVLLKENHKMLKKIIPTGKFSNIAEFDPRRSNHFAV
jgi:hypothetical protein